MLTKMNEIRNWILISILLSLLFSCSERPTPQEQDNVLKDKTNSFEKKEINLPVNQESDFNRNLPIDKIFNSNWIRSYVYSGSTYLTRETGFTSWSDK